MRKFRAYFLLILSIFSLFSFTSAYRTSSKKDIDEDTHYRMLVEAKNVLIADGYSYMIDGGIHKGINYIGIDSYLDDIHYAGEFDDKLDNFWKEHFYNPETDQGFKNLRNGKEALQDYFDMAIYEYKLGNYNMSFIFFGSALHIIQDLANPFHNVLDLTWSHKEYEDYVKDNSDPRDIIDNVDSDGEYSIYNVSDYAISISKISIEYYTYCDNIGDKNHLFVAENVLPHAVRYTAGLIRLFYTKINLDTNYINPDLIENPTKNFEFKLGLFFLIIPFISLILIVLIKSNFKRKK